MRMADAIAQFEVGEASRAFDISVPESFGAGLTAINTLFTAFHRPRCFINDGDNR